MEDNVTHETIHDDNLEPHTKITLDNGEEIFATQTMDSLFNSLMHAKEISGFICVREIKQDEWNNKVRKPIIRYINVRKILFFDEAKKHCTKESMKEDTAGLVHHTKGGIIYYDWPRKLFY